MSSGDCQNGSVHNFWHMDARFKCNDDGFFTFSSTEQKRVEDCVQEFWDAFRERVCLDPTLPLLLREEHIPYLRKGLIVLPQSYQSLDASRPWLCYWMLHSLELLGEPIPEELAGPIISFLSQCVQNGGYGGGPGQTPHLATTYAAIMALCIIGTEDAYNSIDRKGLMSFLAQVKRPDGSFVVHVDGEVDLRGAYCAAAVASILRLPKEKLFDKTAEWVASCQTYEGGFGAEPGAEAHGGYSFCGLATLVLLGHDQLCHLDSLKRWLAWKQMKFEGGYQGRTNKLVDGCYSYWQAAIWPIIRIISQKHKEKLEDHPFLFDSGALQDYVLVCCQHPNGGLVDKPGKNRDFYHTCYCLSGLSIAQRSEGKVCVVGDASNLLVANHPVFNVSVDAERKALKFFDDFAH